MPFTYPISGLFRWKPGQSNHHGAIVSFQEHDDLTSLWMTVLSSSCAGSDFGDCATHPTSTSNTRAYVTEHPYHGEMKVYGLPQCAHMNIILLTFYLSTTVALSHRLYTGEAQATVPDGRDRSDPCL